MKTRWTLAVLCLFLCLGFVSATLAGEISGTVKYRDGSTAKGVAVSGSVSGGGVTGKVYTDSGGRFRLTWSSNNGLAKVFVNGSTVAINVRNGAYVNLTIR